MALVALLLTACGPAPTVVLTSPATTEHGAAHDPQLDRARADLEASGMTFASSGPHHVTGTDADGNQLDFVGVPVEQVVLTFPAADREAARDAATTYLPYARDLLPGPTPVWRWVEDQVACLAEGRTDCDTGFEQGQLEASLTDTGPDFWVVAVSRK